MTERKSKQNGEPRKAVVDAIRKWASEVCKATDQCEAELAGELTEGEEHLFGIARWLAQRARLGCIRGNEVEFAPAQWELDALRALGDRTRSSVYGDKAAGVPVLFELVRQHVGAELPENFRVTDTQPRNLVLKLQHGVHPDFGRLLDRIGDVAALLARWERDPKRRRRANGVPSGLSESGIASELNRLAGRPLGAGDLTPNAISNAAKRKLEGRSAAANTDKVSRKRVKKKPRHHRVT